MLFLQWLPEEDLAILKNFSRNLTVYDREIILLYGNSMRFIWEFYRMNRFLKGIVMISGYW